MLFLIHVQTNGDGGVESVKLFVLLKYAFHQLNGMARTLLKWIIIVQKIRNTTP